MANTGKVIKVSGQFAYVQIKRSSACGRDCSKCLGCSSGVLKVEAKNNINAQEGDWVKVIVEKNSLREAVLWVYVIPLLVFISSYLWIYNRYSLVDSGINELLALAGAFLIMAGSYLTSTYLRKNFSQRRFELILEKYQRP